MKATPNPEVVAEFLKRLGHRVALVGQKPRSSEAPRSMVIWPRQQDDPADQTCWLSSQYGSIFVNLNPLLPSIINELPVIGRSVSDAMIASRTRLLLDVDGHDVPKEQAREQKDAIKAELGEPLIETDSGRGFGLLYEITMPNDEPSKLKIRHYLKKLKERYSCVDTSVFGAGRLTRCIGTPNRSIPTAILN